MISEYFIYAVTCLLQERIKRNSFMRNIFFTWLVICLFADNINAQFRNAQTNDNLANLCRIWGFLKYYHPEVARGTMDWDSVLIALIPAVKNADKLQLNNIYTDLLAKLGTVKTCTACDNKLPGRIKKNLNLEWFGKKNFLSKEIVLKLRYIQLNRTLDSNYYVSGSPYFETKDMANAFFKNEKKYKQMRFPLYEYRLLSLFRFWNIINYYYPYKYSLKEDWNAVLHKMIPVFENTKDTLAYDKALQQLVYSIHDSHADFTTRKLEAEYGEYRAPFYCRIIEGKTVVTKILSDSLCKLAGIKIGDIVEEWDREQISERIKRFNKVIPASNEAVRVRDICFRVLLATRKESASAGVLRNGITVSVNITCLKKQEAFMKQLSDDNTTPAWRKINEGIAYINFGKIKESEIDSIMQAFKNCKAILFDLRVYPKDGSWFSVIQNYIYPGKRNCALVTQPDYSYPGMFKILSGEDALWENTGKENNAGYYKGNVIVLVNDDTQSQGETATMAFRAGPNTILIGTATAGTNGDISEIPFVGGMSANMSGLGFFYPDGNEIQRKGIIPDVKIMQTISGVRNGSDEILQAAINWALQHS